MTTQASTPSELTRTWTRGLSMIAAALLFPVLVGLGFSLYAEVFGTLASGTDAYMPFFWGIGVGSIISFELLFLSLYELRDAHQQKKMLAVLED